MANNNNNESFVLGIWRNVKANRERKALLQRVSKENNNNKNITYCPPTRIEDFFDANDCISNIAFSGANQYLRNRALKCTIQNAVNQGYGVVVLHQGNTELESELKYITSSITVFNRTSSNYEPFIGLSNSEIFRMVQDSAVQCCDMKGASKYYLEGVTEFIRGKKATPCCHMYITCPHLTIVDKVDTAETKGVLNSTVANKIRTLLVQGLDQRCDVENYFNILENQGRGLLATSKSLNRALNLRLLLKRKEVGIVDISSVNNRLILNLIMCDMMNAYNAGYPFLLVVDGISITSNVLLQQYVENSGYNSFSVISNDDIFASVNGNEKILFSVLAKTSKSFIGQHVSGQSCEIFAKHIGQYDKKEIDTSYMQTKQYQSMFSVIPGQMEGSGIHVSSKKEYRVTPDEISKMDYNEFYLMESKHNTLYHVFSL